jgi:DNA-binding CsgD family transcriptional regulator
MEEFTELLPLIGDLYDAAVNESLWLPIASRIAAFLGAESGQLKATDFTNGPVLSLSRTANYTPALMQEYVDHFHRYDEWSIRALPLPPDQVRLGEELIGAAEIERLPFGDLLRRLEVSHLIGAVISIDSTAVGIVGVHRKDAAFDDASRRRLTSLLPHLRRALQLKQRLGAERLQRDIGRQSLDQLAIATLLIEAGGRVVFANAAAVALLREGDGVREAGGRICGGTPGATDVLLGLVAQSARTSVLRGAHPGGATQLPRRDRRPLTALVSPFRSDALIFGASSGLAILFVHDPTRVSVTSTAALQSLFKLSPAEARLAAALGDGKSVEAFAKESGYSVHTVRTLLRRVMLKTATKRQGELIALILRSGAALHSADSTAGVRE